MSSPRARSSRSERTASPPQRLMASASGHQQSDAESAAPRGTPERLAYTVEEAAMILGVGRDLLFDEIRTGRLRSKKAGARRVIARHHLLEWLDSDAPQNDRRAG
jgi:excisionase family DNA binding protein